MTVDATVAPLRSYLSFVSIMLRNSSATSVGLESFQAPSLLGGPSGISSGLDGRDDCPASQAEEFGFNIFR